MEQNHLAQGKDFILLWLGSKRRVFHITLLLSICIWVYLQMASSHHNYGSASTDETTLHGASKGSRKLLSRQWIFEDETNEPWDVVSGEDARLVTMKEDGGVGDDDFDDDVEEEEESEEDNEDDVENMVRLDDQATMDRIRVEFREVETDTFNDVNGSPPGNLYGNSSNMTGSEDVGTTMGATIDPELEEFFEIGTV